MSQSSKMLGVCLALLCSWTDVSAQSTLGYVQLGVTGLGRWSDEGYEQQRLWITEDFFVQSFDQIRIIDRSYEPSGTVRGDRGIFNLYRNGNRLYAIHYWAIYYGREQVQERHPWEIHGVKRTEYYYWDIGYINPRTSRVELNDETSLGLEWNQNLGLWEAVLRY